MFWFWWLLTPFVGRNLAEVTHELETKVTNHVIERCAVLAHQNEVAACLAVRNNTIELARSGFFGSTIPDQVRIFELEQQVELQRLVIESQQLAFERMSWLAQQDGE